MTLPPTQMPFPNVLIAGIPWLLFFFLALIFGLLATSILRMGSPRSPAPLMAGRPTAKTASPSDIEGGLSVPATPPQHLPPYATQLIHPLPPTVPAHPGPMWQPVLVPAADGAGAALMPPPVLASGFAYHY